MTAFPRLRDIESALTSAQIFEPDEPCYVAPLAVLPREVRWGHDVAMGMSAPDTCWAAEGWLRRRGRWRGLGAVVWIDASRAPRRSWWYIAAHEVAHQLQLTRTTRAFDRASAWRYLQLSERYDQTGGDPTQSPSAGRDEDEVALRDHDAGWLRAVIHVTWRLRQVGVDVPPVVTDRAQAEGLEDLADYRLPPLCLCVRHLLAELLSDPRTVREIVSEPAPCAFTACVDHFRQRRLAAEATTASS